jgi:hypothetical protein
MPTEAVVRARLQAFLDDRDGRLRVLVRQLGTGWSHVKLGRFLKGRPCLEAAKLTQLDGVLDDADTGPKQDCRLDDPDRLAIARGVQNARDPCWPYTFTRYDFAAPIRTFYGVVRDRGGGRDEAAQARHLVLPRIRAGLVRDIDGVHPRARWLLGRLRLFRARRATPATQPQRAVEVLCYELAGVAQWARTVAHQQQDSPHRLGIDPKAVTAARPTAKLDSKSPCSGES